MPSVVVGSPIDVHPGNVSATAKLIARAVAHLGSDPIRGPFLPAGASEMSRAIVEAVFGDARLLRRLRHPVGRAATAFAERFTIPGLFLHYALRKRFIESTVRSRLSAGARRVSVLAAGLDTLAPRLADEFPDVTFTEIDHPVTQAVKRRALALTGTARSNLQLIAADFRQVGVDDLAALIGAGAAGDGVVVAEGLSMYLTGDENRRLLRAARDACGAGGTLIFSVMRLVDGRLPCFHNASFLADVWLRLRGEPFRFGLRAEELEPALAGEGVTAVEVVASDDLRERFLKGTDCADRELASGEDICVAVPMARPRPAVVHVARQVAYGRDAGRSIAVNDVHSELNRTVVAEIARPASVSEVQSIMARAGRAGTRVSVMGSRHSMGGQQFATGGLALDMTGLARPLGLDSRRGIVEVEAGITWPALVDYLVASQGDTAGIWTIRQKQTGADDFTLGGSLSSNIHGRALDLPPIASDVESFRMVMADGSLVTCDRARNPELFSLAIGGYGLFGVIVSVRLRLMRRVKLRRSVRLLHVDRLVAEIDAGVASGDLYGDLQYVTASELPTFMSGGIASTYRPVAHDLEIPSRQREIAPDEWRALYHLAHTDKARAFEVYAAHYRATDGQIYWSDAHQMSTYLPGQHRELDRALGLRVAGSLMISELYVPRAALAAFMASARAVARSQSFDIVYGTVRFIRRDVDTFMPWAKGDHACVIVNIRVEHDDPGLNRARRQFRTLIDVAIAHGGGYYLTYHRWARADQVLACYPELPAFIDRKLRFDPGEVFASDWYRHQRRLVGA